MTHKRDDPESGVPGATRFETKMPGLLGRARRHWESMAGFRRERERNKRYAFGDQWADLIEVDGEMITEELEQAYPEPRAGSWALVGDKLPAALYVARGRRWVATGHDGGQIIVKVAEGGNGGDQTTCGCADAIDALELRVERSEAAADRAHNRALANGILPFDGFNPFRGGARPTKGVWFVPPQVNFPGFFWVVSSDYGLTSEDYNNPDLTLQGDAEISPARTDRFYRCGNAIYAFDGNDLTVVASEPELVESSAEMQRLIDQGNTRRGQFYCVVDPGSRMVNSMYVG